ncbi:MHYT domain-containing protein, partial [Dankookia sp. GCM10030260]|uniref:MHYT domain-containing protein n=1 Tax=Dankookia sp. GCM10030260 TaxID=3273390 RepID=UPI003609E9CA
YGAGPARTGLAGLLMGLGIAAMHYTGMAAMRMPASVEYNPLLVAASVLIAIGASVAALWIAARGTSAQFRVLAAGAMGLAIAGMHYTAMWAATFTGPGALADGTHGHTHADQAALALGVAIVTFLILSLSLLAAVVDRRFARLAEREAEALRASEARFRALYQRTPLPLHSLGPDGAVLETSDAWLALFGYRREEVIGRSLAAFMPPDCARRYGEEHWPALLAGRDLHEAECQVIAKDGRVLDVLLSASPERDVEGRLVRCLGGLADVTARRHVEEALRQSQKLEAVGQLTGGVAHDFNNLLTVVLGALSSLERHVRGDERAYQMLEAARQAVRRGARLSQSLLAFSRRQALRPEALDAATLLQEFTTLIRRALGETIALELAFEPRLPLCRADAAQLQTAVLNLVVNARDAMPEGGTLSIRAARAELGPAELAGNDDAAPGAFVAVAVRDTGHGMPPEVLARAFEPFFTTKEPGRGTGLGLAQVYGFARQLGGHVAVESR